VPSPRPLPHTTEDDGINVLKGMLTHHVPMIVGPTAAGTLLGGKGTDRFRHTHAVSELLGHGVLRTGLDEAKAGSVGRHSYTWNPRKSRVLGVSSGAGEEITEDNTRSGPAENTPAEES
jgi:hypothetical protein